MQYQDATVLTQPANVSQFYVDLTDRVALARTSVRQVCLRAGIERSTVERWKQAEQNYRPETLDRFNAALMQIAEENGTAARLKVAEVPAE